MLPSSQLEPRYATWQTLLFLLENKNIRNIAFGEKILISFGLNYYFQCPISKQLIKKKQKKQKKNSTHSNMGSKALGEVRSAGTNEVPYFLNLRNATSSLSAILGIIQSHREVASSTHPLYLYNFFLMWTCFSFSKKSLEFATILLLL